jgi:hypothetical protein
MKTHISMFWDIPEDSCISPDVHVPATYGSPEWDLLGVCKETAPHRRVGDKWEFCPNVFPLFTTHIPGTETFDCDNPINHISNIPQNYEHQFVSEGYELEIIDGIMSINFIFEEETKVRISIEEFKKFHNAYCHVKVTHEPMEFDIELL